MIGEAYGTALAIVLKNLSNSAWNERGFCVFCSLVKKNNATDFTRAHKYSPENFFRESAADMLHERRLL